MSVSVLQFLLICSLFVFHPMFILCYSSMQFTKLGVGNSETDRMALLAIKAKIEHDPNQVMSTWNHSTHFCLWYGVTCSGQPHPQRVTTLDLASQGLVGSISPHIGNLSFLRKVYLYNNSFTHEIPPQIGRLRRLKVLFLLNNSFTGPIPANISNCFNLLGLQLADNKLVGEIPSRLGFLSKLRYLSLAKNKLTGEIPSTLGNLTSLTSLYATSNNLVGNIPASFGKLKNLTVLSLGGNRLFGSIPPSIYNLSAIEVLSLPTNQLQGNLPESVGNLSRLEVLSLSFNSISGPIPASLGSLSQLLYLLLSTNSISGPIPMSLGNLSHLEVLSLSFNSISGSIPASLGRLSQLQYLLLFSNSISGALPISIGNLSHLKFLVLSDNPKMNGTIPETIGQLTELRWLGLRGCSWEGTLSENHFENLINLDFFELSSQISSFFVFNVSHDWIPIFSLTRIAISDCKLMNTTTFPAWLRTQQLLRMVILSNVGISDTIPNWFWRNSKFLKVLDLSRNQLQGKLPNSVHSDLEIVNLKNNILVGTLPLWPNLTHLSLANNKFSGPIPLNIGRKMSKLSYLDLSKNNLNGSLPPSLNKMKSLSVMDLSRNYVYGKIPRDWAGFRDFEIIDLSNNNLSGPIPNTLCSQLPSLKWLRLSSNKLSGNLGMSLQNCKFLIGLDLTGNTFFGPLIGENLQNLSYLLLGDNKFSGNIPHQLCDLSSLQVLDVSLNNLSGTIPTCLGNLKEMTQGSGSPRPWKYLYSQLSTYAVAFLATPIDLTDYGTVPIHIDLNMKGVKYEYAAHVMELVQKLDLSSNNLLGEIPEEIRNLVALGSLNLSHNHLTGKIPEGLGSLQRLEALDLSGNHLWGSIPSSMTNMTSLSTLNLSSNNLSGPIPSANQFQTFNDPTSFEGNSGLCGGPLPTQCGSPPIPDPKVEEEDEQDKYGRLWLYAGTAIGFIVGFWVVFGSLVIKRSWRHAYFRFLDKIKDRLSFW